MKSQLARLAGLACLLALFACQRSPIGTFTIIAAPETQEISDIVMEFAKAKGVKVLFRYERGTNFINALRGEGLEADAVWASTMLWLKEADTGRRTSLAATIFSSPTVAVVTKDKLPLLKGKGRFLNIDALRDARYIMASPVQDPAGAAAYFGLLQGFSDAERKLDLGALQHDRLSSALAGLALTTASAGELPVVMESGRYDAMFTSEYDAVNYNKQRQEKNEEPLEIIYFRQAPSAMSAVLAYVDHRDSLRRKFFAELQHHLLNEEIQQKIRTRGFRTVFGSSYEGGLWSGLSTNEKVSSDLFLSAPVIHTALEMYQARLRRPSYTFFIIDFGSKLDAGRRPAIRKALNSIMFADGSTDLWLRPTEKDKTEIRLVGGVADRRLTLETSDRLRAQNSLAEIEYTTPGGQAPLPVAAAAALKQACEDDGRQHRVSVVLLSFSRLPKEHGKLPLPAACEKGVPLFIIAPPWAADSFSSWASGAGGIVIESKGDVQADLEAIRAYL